jgi:hypothetical protein
MPIEIKSADLYRITLLFLLERGWGEALQMYDFFKLKTALIAMKQSILQTYLLVCTK